MITHSAKKNITTERAVKVGVGGDREVGGMGAGQYRGGGRSS